MKSHESENKKLWRIEMIEKPIVFNFYNYGTPFYGSSYNMRYRLAKEGEKPEFTFTATVWPEPYSFTDTKEEEKVKESFSFDEDGYSKAIEWLNAQQKNYEVKR